MKCDPSCPYGRPSGLPRRASFRVRFRFRFRRAVAVQPDLAEAWLHLGKLLVLGGRKGEAKEAFLTAEKARGGAYPEARLELERLATP